MQRNYRVARGPGARGGEIDLVMRDGDCLVVVEVKARSSARFGTPQEAVVGRKLHRLAALAETYCRLRGISGRRRIDVVAVDLGPTGEPLRCRHLRDVLT